MSPALKAFVLTLIARMEVMVSDQEKTVNDMIICNSLIAAWLLLLSLTGCLERIHLHHLVDASSQIEIGATEVVHELNR